MATRLGVMGGTFDPVHFGHLLIAEMARHEFGLEKVLFVPAKVPPHKGTEFVTPARHRYVMTVLATLTNPFFEVSRVDIDREGVSYTVDTLRMLQERYGPDVELFFISGFDSLLQLSTWKDPEGILHLCHFVVANRPGYEGGAGADIPAPLQRFSHRIHHIQVPGMEISSTDIRRRVDEGLPIRYLTPDIVVNYISENGLYRGTD